MARRRSPGVHVALLVLLTGSKLFRDIEGELTYGMTASGSERGEDIVLRERVRT
jgi:hypothetical protein